MLITLYSQNPVDDPVKVDIPDLNGEVNVDNDENGVPSIISSYHYNSDLECEKCDLVFKQTADLTKHIKEIHENSKNHFCSQCDEAFYRAHQLIKHIDEVHEGLQGIPSQTGKSNLALREGRQDISDILWKFFSR